MAKLLYIDACIREENSRTRALAEAYLDAYRAAHPQDGIETVDLSRTALKPLDCAALGAGYLASNLELLGRIGKNHPLTE